MSDYSIASFIADLHDVVARHEEDQRALCASAAAILRRLIADPSPARIPHDPDLAQQEIRELLYGDPADAFTIWLGPFAPGSATPVHDHGTWGVVGVWQGQECDERFTRLDDGSRPRHARLSLVSSTVMPRGSVYYFTPPDDIHRVTNIGDTVARSIHIYGRAQEQFPTRVFDLRSESVTTWEEDAIASAQAWGMHIDLGALVGARGASDHDLLHALSERLARARSAAGLS